MTATATQGDITVSATASVTVEPDRIAFVSDRSGDQFDIYILNSDGTNVRRLTSTSEIEFLVSWSRDGRRIVFDSCGEICAIYAMNDDGDWLLNLYGEEDDAFPSWSPDGRRIAFTTFMDETIEIFVIDVDGGNLTRLTDNSAVDVFPTWSSDGSKIAFVSDRRDDDGDIYVMNADGSNQRRLTDDPAADTLPSWSPNGRKIVFASERDGDSEIYVMDANGRDVVQLTSNRRFDGTPSWSADGTQIVFNSTRDVADADDIYIMDADGTNVRRLTSNSAIDASARWAPRKRGLEVTEESVVVPDASALSRTTTVQGLTATARAAVVRIETDLGSGSGFIIDPDGLILTANHVITDAEDLTVFMDDGTSYSATVRGRDLVRDLAVLEIQASDLPTLEIGDLSQLSQGQQVVVLGYPLAAHPRNTVGEWLNI